MSAKPAADLPPNVCNFRLSEVRNFRLSLTAGKVSGRSQAEPQPPPRILAGASQEGFGRGIGLVERRSARCICCGEVTFKGFEQDLAGPGREVEVSHLAQGGEALEGLGGEADLEGGVARHALHGTGSTGIFLATRTKEQIASGASHHDARNSW